MSYLVVKPVNHHNGWMGKIFPMVTECHFYLGDNWQLSNWTNHPLNGMGGIPTQHCKPKQLTTAGAKLYAEVNLLLPFSYANIISYCTINTLIPTDKFTSHRSSKTFVLLTANEDLLQRSTNGQKQRINDHGVPRLNSYIYSITINLKFRESARRGSGKIVRGRGQGCLLWVCAF